MKNLEQAEPKIAELTLKSIVLAVFLTALLAASNAYLALKLGILTAASIPAAIVSMGILRLFKKSTILENNAVQTAASAGEAVAGGIVYTIPALVILHYWQRFDFFTNFFIAASSGILGVFFSIPLRRMLVKDSRLKFPEGQAIAEILKSSAANASVRPIFMGALIAAGLELFQTGFKVIQGSWNAWFMSKKVLFGFGLGFSATMIGAGALMGYEMALSIFLGALISWVFGLPIASYFCSDCLARQPAEAAMWLWNEKMRYLGIGAMLFAGIWTFLRLLKPLAQNMSFSLVLPFSRNKESVALARTEKDLPLAFLLLGIALFAALLFLFIQFALPLANTGLNANFLPTFAFVIVVYILGLGFLFSVISAYFSGMVGVTASPGSSILIAGMLFTAWSLLWLLRQGAPLPLSDLQLESTAAIAIFIGAMLTGIAAIANDNIQDLKVGQLVGATPWKQQLMLLLGVLVAALIIPPLMQILFEVYGIAQVLPYPGMDPSQSLPAPTAVMMATLTEAVFHHRVPWLIIGFGAAIVLILLPFSVFLQKRLRLHLSLLGIGIGMYLPLSSSFPLFLGGLIALWIQIKAKKQQGEEGRRLALQHLGLIACGLIAGSSLMDVLLAIPFSLSRSLDILSLVGPHWKKEGLFLAFISLWLLAYWMKVSALVGMNKKLKEEGSI